MPWYSGDHLRDTQHLDAEQDGAYRRLIDACWLANGLLIDDNTRFAAITKLPVQRWRKIRPVIAEFFQETPEGWRHKRIDQEIDKASKLSETRQRVGAFAAAKRWSKPDSSANASGITPGNASSMPEACTEDTQPQPQPQPQLQRDSSARGGASRAPAREEAGKAPRRAGEAVDQEDKKAPPQAPPQAPPPPTKGRRSGSGEGYAGKTFSLTTDEKEQCRARYPFDDLNIQLLIYDAKFEEMHLSPSLDRIMRWLSEETAPIHERAKRYRANSAAANGRDPEFNALDDPLYRELRDDLDDLAAENLDDDPDNPDDE
jgi:uncharacterized protein YdaU (DUF1376 family)